MNLLLSTLLLICYFYINTQAACIPTTHLPQLYFTDISIVKFNKDVWDKPSTRYNYIQNIPLELLRQSKAYELHTLITLNSFQWSGTNRTIRFMPSKYNSETAILISFQSEYIIWEFFNFKLLINDYKYRPEIYLGDLIHTIPSENSGFAEVYAQFPQKKAYSKSICFITGIHAKAIGLTGEQYDISVNEKIQNSSMLRIVIQIGATTSLQKILISYAVYNSVQNQEYEIVSGYFRFGPTPSGQFFNKLKDSLPVNQGYALGISSLKIKQAYNAFGINLKTLQRNLLRVESQTSFQFLAVGYLGIGVTIASACDACQIQQYVYADEQSAFCLPKCPSDTQIIVQNDKKICQKCYRQLNMELRNGLCVCQTGFIEYNGKCLPESQIQKAITTATYSQADQNVCIEKNMVYRNSECVCKDGYRKNAQGICENQCQRGYWDGRCIYCQDNQYPYEELKQCRSCADNCAYCQTINVCGFCQVGFINFNGGCIQRCGDGRKVLAECDDGNTDNMDGCSSECKIQKGYSCRGGSASTPDICSKISYSYIFLGDKIVNNGYLVRYQVNPVPTLFTNEQLKDRIRVQVRNNNLYFAYQVYIAQDYSNPSLIQIFLSFIDYPTQNLSIDILFGLGEGLPTTKTVMANFIQVNSFASSRLDNTRLT